jgi:hypothetical protein
MPAARGGAPRGDTRMPVARGKPLCTVPKSSGLAGTSHARVTPVCGLEPRQVGALRYVAAYGGGLACFREDFGAVRHICRASLPVGIRQEEQCGEACAPRGQVCTPHFFRHLTMYIGHERRPPSTLRATSDTTLAGSPGRQWAMCTAETGHTVSTAHLLCRQRCHSAQHRSIDGVYRSRWPEIRARKGADGRVFFALWLRSP